MSEESSSTPLRLKPKLKVDSESLPNATGSNIASTSAAGESAVQDENLVGLKLKPKSAVAETVTGAGVVSGGQAATESRVRLKPRLNAQTEAQPAAPTQVSPETPTPAVIAPPVPPVAAAPVSAVTEDAGPAVVGGFKLRPKTAGDEPPALPKPVAPVRAPETSSSNVPVAPAVARPRVKPSPELVKSFASGNTAPPFQKGSKSGRRSALTVVVLLLIVAAGTYYAYTTYLTPAPEVVASEPEPASADVTEPASLPGRLVGKAQDVVNTRAGELEGLDELGIESRLQSSSSEPTEPRVMASMPVRAEAPPEPEPEMSEAFHRFVTEMRVSGVFQGDPARALVNGRMVRAGEPLDLGLGIVFTGIDAEKHLILMQEPTGARAAKKY